MVLFETFLCLLLIHLFKSLPMKYIVPFVSPRPALFPNPWWSKTTAGYKGQGEDASPGIFFVISIGLKKGRPEIFGQALGEVTAKNEHIIVSDN